VNRDLAKIAKAIQSSVNLKTLSHYGLDADSKANGVLDALQTNKSITECTFLRCKIDMARVEAMVSANKCLTSLNLSGCEISISNLTRALEINTTLKTLGLSSNNLYQKMPEVVKMCKKSSITGLDLSGNSIGINNMADLVEILELKSLKTLNLADNRFTYDVLKTMCKALTNSSVENLILANNRIQCDAAVELARCLSSSALTALDLSYNSIGSVGLAALCQSLSNDSKLVSLDMGGNEFDKNTVDCLSKALETNTSLEFLGVSNTRHMGSLKINTSLKSLAVARCSLGTDASVAIAESGKFLTHLDLSNNDINDDGASRIANFLTNNRRLIELKLSSNKIGSFGAVRIARAITFNTTLIRLYMSLNRIGDRGARCLADALVHSSVEDCRLNYNEFSDPEIVKTINKLTIRNIAKRKHRETVLARMVIGMAFARANKTSDLKYAGLQQAVQNPILEFISSEKELIFAKRQSAFSHTAYFQEHLKE
jgi:Ran GTPase-activating protein (RanGAP) involved in mRNA processing and transport